MAKKEEVTKKNSAKKKSPSKTKVSTAKKTSTKSTKNKKENKKIDIKVILGLIGILVIIVSFVFLLVMKKDDKLIMTIDNIEYKESDFNMYAYLIKYDYFGASGTDLSEETLKTQVSNDSEQTIGEYLKEKTISKMKVSGAILRIANENNITLNNEALKEIEEEKDEFIDTLGGKKAFKEMLSKNGTTEEAYMEVAKVDKLYDIIYDSLYKEDKRNDLTTEEIEDFQKSYQTDYVKIKQIILLKKDLNTNQYLDEITLNQKEILANSLANQAKKEEFDSLVKKYSEGYNGNEISEYYLKTELIEELRNAIDLLRVGDISGVVSTDYAYHIVIREQLDDSRLEDYLNSKREEKLIEDISGNLEKIAIIKGDYLEEIIVK